MKKILAILLALITFGFHAKTQVLLEPDLIKKDLVFLKSSIEKYHPNPYFYTSKERIDFVADSIYSTINQPISYKDAYKKLQTFMAEIKDGHTNMNFEVEKKRKVSYPSYFPLYSRIINNEIIVLFNTSNDTLIKSGAKILKIEGKSVDEIRQRTYNLMSADNGNLAWKNAAFANSISFGIDSNDSVNVVYQNFGSEEIVETKVKMQSIQTFGQILNTRYPEPPGLSNFEFVQIDSVKNTYLLNLNGWSEDGFDKKNKNLEEHFKKSFAILKQNQVQNLIIDLRGNSGGNSEIAENLLSYLMDSDGYVIDSQLVKKSAIRKLDFPRRMEVRFKLKKLANSSVKVSGKVNDFKYKSKGKNQVFDGNIYLINNGLGYSSTCIFDAVLKNRPNTFFINAATGGARWGGFALNSYRGFLPNSKLKFNIPLIQFWNQKGNINEGNFLIEPDFPVKISQEDIANGSSKMKVMNFVLEMIRDKN
jgi:hypothetical protein